MFTCAPIDSLVSAIFSPASRQSNSSCVMSNLKHRKFMLCESLLSHTAHWSNSGGRCKPTLWSCHFLPPSPVSHPWPQGCLGSPCAGMYSQYLCHFHFLNRTEKKLQRCFCYLSMEFYFKAEVLGIQSDDVAISIVQAPLLELKKRKNNHQSLMPNLKNAMFLRGCIDLEPPE